MAAGQSGFVFSLGLLMFLLNTCVLTKDHYFTRDRYLDAGEFIIDCSNWEFKDISLIQYVSYFTCDSPPDIYIGGNEIEKRFVKCLDRHNTCGHKTVQTLMGFISFWYATFI